MVKHIIISSSSLRNCPGLLGAKKKQVTYYISHHSKHYNYITVCIFKTPRTTVVNTCRLKRHIQLLTLWLPRPATFPGWTMHGRTRKQYISQFYNTSIFSAVRLDENRFTCQCETRQKGLKVSSFAFFFLLVAFKGHLGSEGVKQSQNLKKLTTLDACSRWVSGYRRLRLSVSCPRAVQKNMNCQLIDFLSTCFLLPRSATAHCQTLDSCTSRHTVSFLK